LNIGYSSHKIALLDLFQNQIYFEEMEKIISRYIEPYIQNDLSKKMVFIGGPRQVGKTTMARNLLQKVDADGIYFNWDNDEDRRDLLAKKWSQRNKIIIFDELHKYPKWKNWIKGVYDIENEWHKIIVTGSARLDIYKQGGDSLMGRYHYWRLHPFSLDEIPVGLNKHEALHRLMTVGGFPEPFLDGDEREARRWRRERFDRVVMEDIRDLEPIRNIQMIKILVDQLRTRVGGLVKIANLANELQVAHKTIKHWLEVLEQMYLLFSIKPFTRSIPRAVLKPPKIYFFDNADVIGDEGNRFENLIATNLLKRMHYLVDRDGYRYELMYIRDKEGREVDFAIVKDGLLEELIEVKLSDDTISNSLRYYAERLNPRRAVQIVKNIKRPYDKNRLQVMDPLSYFNGFN
jgi:uncharacterized protein